MELSNHDSSVVHSRGGLSVSKLLKIVLLVLAVSPLAFAAETAPSDASIKELLTLTQSRKLMEGAMGQMEASVQSMTQHELANEKITPKQKTILEDMQKKMFVMIKENMNWDAIEPTFADVYKKTFSQHEVDGMIAFYKSDVGQSVIAKMPQVMHETMQAVQQRMMTLIPKLQQLQRETAAKMQQAAQK